MTLNREPKGADRPRRRIKLGAKEVGAALMIATAPAAAQETQFKTEQVRLDLADEAREALKNARAEFENLRSFTRKKDDIDEKYERLFNETEEALKDPAYLEGLRKIKQFGGTSKR